MYFNLECLGMRTVRMTACILQGGSDMTGTEQVLTRAGGRVEVVASLSQGRTAAA